MSEAFTGEIRATAFGNVPHGWLACNGQQLSVSSYGALFTLLGTSYGGDGINTFALPDLRGRVPIGVGPTTPIGQNAGEALHALTLEEIPSHLHTMVVSKNKAAGSGGVSPGPGMSIGAPSNPGTGAPLNLYGDAAPTQSMAQAAIATQGSGQPHENRQPYGVISYMICVQGIYPPRP